MLKIPIIKQIGAPAEEREDSSAIDRGICTGEKGLPSYRERTPQLQREDSPATDRGLGIQ